MAHAVLHRFNRERQFKVFRTFLTFHQFQETGQVRTVFAQVLNS